MSCGYWTVINWILSSNKNIMSSKLNLCNKVLLIKFAI